MGIENVDALKPEPNEALESTEENLEQFAESTAHPVDENPEDHCGDEMPDPWSDPKQTDWPMNDDVSAPVEAPKEES